MGFRAGELADGRATVTLAGSPQTPWVRSPAEFCATLRTLRWDWRSLAHSYLRNNNSFHP